MALEKSKSIEAELQTLSTNVPQEEKSKELTFWQKSKIIFSNITVEPIMVTYVLPSIMASLSAQNLALEKACRVNLELDQSTCDALTIRNSSGYTKNDEVAVQKLVASMAAWKTVIQSLLPSIMLMFLGMIFISA